MLELGSQCSRVQSGGFWEAIAPSQLCLPLGGVKARLYYRKTARSGRWGPSWKKWFLLEGWEGQKSRCQSEVRTAELMCFVGSFEKKLLPQSGLFTLLSSPTVYPLAAKSIFRESAPWRRHPCPQTLVAGDTQDEKWHMTLFTDTHWRVCSARFQSPTYVPALFLKVRAGTVLYLTL